MIEVLFNKVSCGKCRVFRRAITIYNLQLWIILSDLVNMRGGYNIASCKQIFQVSKDICTSFSYLGKKSRSQPECCDLILNQFLTQGFGIKNGLFFNNIKSPAIKKWCPNLKCCGIEYDSPCQKYPWIRRKFHIICITNQPDYSGLYYHTSFGLSGSTGSIHYVSQIWRRIYVFRIGSIGVIWLRRVQVQRLDTINWNFAELILQYQNFTSGVIKHKAYSLFRVFRINWNITTSCLQNT